MKVYLLTKDNIKTKLMQHFDMFEKSKVLVMPLLKASLEPGTPLDHAWVERVRDSCKGQPYSLVAVFDGEQTYWQDPDVKSVSTGEAWTSIENYILAQQSRF